MAVGFPHSAWKTRLQFGQLIIDGKITEQVGIRVRAGADTCGIKMNQAVWGIAPVAFLARFNNYPLGIENHHLHPVNQLLMSYFQ